MTVGDWLAHWLASRTSPAASTMRGASTADETFVRLWVPLGGLVAVALAGAIYSAVTANTFHRDWPQVAAVALLLAVLFFFTVFVTSAGTIINVLTHAEAPTFWQRRGGDIIIAVVIAAAFYVLGKFT